VKEWQNRPWEKTDAIRYLEAIRVKAEQEGKSCRKSVGVNLEGQKEVGETKFRTGSG
jgi:transposase-like protein